MKGWVIVLLVGLVFTGFSFAATLLPGKEITDERIRLDTSQANYVDGAGGEGYAIGLPAREAGDVVKLAWTLRAPYDVRVASAGAGGTPPGAGDARVHLAVNATEAGNATFTAPEAGDYWLTLTRDATLASGSVTLVYEPPLVIGKNPVYEDLTVALLVATGLATVVMWGALRLRDRQRASNDR